MHQLVGLALLTGMLGCVEANVPGQVTGDWTKSRSCGRRATTDGCAAIR
jgi:hypothetical protein